LNITLVEPDGFETPDACFTVAVNLPVAPLPALRFLQLIGRVLITLVIVTLDGHAPGVARPWHGDLLNCSTSPDPEVLTICVGSRTSMMSPRV
jgi:hypothetical protein